MKPTTKRDASYFQKMLRLYLRSYREDHKLTVQELADLMNCSKTKVEKMEHPSNPSPPIASISSLQSLAELRNLDVDSFVSIVLGKANEEGEQNPFVIDLVNDIRRLPNDQQVKMKLGLTRPEAAENGIDVYWKFLKSDLKTKLLIKAILDLAEAYPGVLSKSDDEAELAEILLRFIRSNSETRNMIKIIPSLPEPLRQALHDLIFSIFKMSGKK